MASNRDWSSLPDLVLSMILDKITESIDRISCSVLCKHWHSIYVDNKRMPLSTIQHLPMLLIPVLGTAPTPKNEDLEDDKSYEDLEDDELYEDLEDDESYPLAHDPIETARSLYTITSGKLYERKLPVPYQRRACGSHYGWLAVVQDDVTITLFNPFNGGIINLPKAKYPHHRTYKEYEFTKLILTADPAIAPYDYLAVAIYGEYKHLAIYKSGHDSWTFISCDIFGHYFSDIIVYRGLIYIVGHRCEIFSCDAISKGASWPPELKEVAPRDQRPKYVQQVYLVESSKGVLMLVERYLDGEGNKDYVTHKFKVFRLKLCERSGRMIEKVEVKSIGGDAMFLGDNYSMAISTANFSSSSSSLCLQPNSIYYTSDHCDIGLVYAPQDMGIYSMEDQTFRHHHQIGVSEENLPPSQWIMPPY